VRGIGRVSNAKHWYLRRDVRVSPKLKQSPDRGTFLVRKQQQEERPTHQQEQQQSEGYTTLQVSKIRQEEDQHPDSETQRCFTSSFPHLLFATVAKQPHRLWCSRGRRRVGTLRRTCEGESQSTKGTRELEPHVRAYFTAFRVWKDEIS